MSKIVSRNELQVRMQVNPGLVSLEALPEKYFNDWHLPGARRHRRSDVRAGDHRPKRGGEDYGEVAPMTRWPMTRCPDGSVRPERL